MAIPGAIAHLFPPVAVHEWRGGGGAFSRFTLDLKP